MAIGDRFERDRIGIRLYVLLTGKDQLHLHAAVVEANREVQLGLGLGQQAQRFAMTFSLTSGGAGSQPLGFHRRVGDRGAVAGPSPTTQTEPVLVGTVANDTSGLRTGNSC